MTKKLDKRNVLIIGDTHLPFEQKGYLEFCLKIKKEHNCGTVVHIGDLCFKPDCEIMTQDGFKRFDKLQTNDLVMQVDSFGIGNLVSPTRFINKKYNGDIVSHIGKSYSISATKGHNLVYYHKKDLFKKIPIERLKKSSYYRIPRTIQYSGKGINFTDDEIRLQVAIRADFSVSQKGIGFRGSFKKERKKERIINLLNKLPIEYSTTVENNRQGYMRVFLLSSEYTKKFNKKLRKNWLTNLSNHQMKVYIDELKYWDGYDDKISDRCVFSTKCDEEAKFIQTMSHLIGLSANINENSTGQKRVNILFNKKDTRTTLLKTSTQYYTGNVYCVTVPTGMILVRQDNNISVVGNCDNHSISYHEHDPDLWSPKEEMDKVDLVLKNWFKAFPILYLCRGNHDCYDEKTEILTRIGWKKGIDLDKYDSVATLNIDNNQIEYQIPSDIILKEYNGEMIRIKSERNIDLLVTPSHRMLISDKMTRINDPIYKFKKAHTLNNAYRYFIVSGDNNKNDYDIDDNWLKLIGWVLTDGGKEKYNAYTIYQSKKENLDKIRDILQCLKIDYKETIKIRNTHNICGKELIKLPLPSHEFSFNSQILSIYIEDKYILPEFLYFISKRQFDVFFNSVLDGDGTKFWETRSPNRQSCVLYGTEKILSQFQGLCIQNKHMATLVEYKNGDWKLNVIRNKIKVGVRDKIKCVDYKGKVWCATVDNSTLVVRRNGIVSIQGNCLVDRKAKTAHLPKRCFKPFRDIWNLPKGWKDDFHFIIDKVLYTHGTGNSGKLAHLNLALHNRMSTVMGHSHSFAGIAFTASPRDCIFGMNVGSGVDNSALAFAYGKDLKTKPIVSCGVISNGEDPCIFRMRL